MRAMGIIRRLDELGRVVIPVEMRRMLDLADRDTVEIAVDGDRIVLQKHTPRCVFCSRSEALVEYHNRRVCATSPIPVGYRDEISVINVFRVGSGDRDDEAIA